ncbi:phosphopantetheine-binding protein [Streptomyces sp. WAC05374]|uniref:phosphopantetheine-binding protein n=1 Tax=Streptomyces sp. WAC05374 TaxID=2487420 RepID=UPI0021AF2E7D|nr:phosphopantetheine-binding protein [Streptomyces sp. WAC05374]
MTTTPEATRTDRRTATAAEIAAYRAAARAGLPPAAHAQPSPVHAFVLAHTAADRTVRSLTGGEEASVVHLGQDIQLERPVRPGEPVTVAVDVLGAHELADDHDLLSDGVIDSLGVLKLIAWVEDHFQLAVGDADLDPDNFRSVAAIDAFIAGARQGVGG